MNLAATRERLRELERRRELDQQLAPNVEGLPWAELVWLLQFPAFLGLAVHVAFLASEAADTGVAPSAGEFVWLVVLAVVALVLRHGGPLLRTPAQRLRRRLRRKGVLVPVAIVQANNAFHDEGNRQWLPATVLLSFDPAVVQWPARLESVAARVLALKSRDRSTLPGPEAELAWTLYHEMGPVTSLRVPDELTEGLLDCMLASVLLPPQPARIGALCLALALPGQSSPHAVAVLPVAMVQ